jgi:hypothetical protein
MSPAIRTIPLDVPLAALALIESNAPAASTVAPRDAEILDLVVSSGLTPTTPDAQHAIEIQSLSRASLRRVLGG